jgi:DNA polymerase (family 10)
MDNNAIADNFSLLSKVIDIHGDDGFKAKTYSIAAYTIENLPVQLSSLTSDKIFSIKNIGSATGKKIIEQLGTGRLNILDDYLLKTPAGILEMLRIKGLGPKKISVIWKQLGIENIGELLYACEENRLLLTKGFGAKTQQNIKEAIVFFVNSQGSYLYAQIADFAAAFTKKMKESFPSKQFLLTGDANRHAEVIHKIEWVTDTAADELEAYFMNEEYSIETEEEVITVRGPQNVTIRFTSVPSNLLYNRAFVNNCSEEFFLEWRDKYDWDPSASYNSEEEIFEKAGLPFIAPFLREFPAVIKQAESKTLPEVIQVKDIRAIIHAHSDWSDGVNTIEDMAKAAIKKGFEYLVISDHSQSAYYAKGLLPDRIKAQHELIDELNEKVKPFKIFKSIESDILNDGSLDYDERVLSTFDLVITSVHSNLKMSEEKAMARLLEAIANRYTTILGHMTGRLLLSRSGYPVNYQTIINACADHDVVIELNAHSRRLDMDWRQIPKALEKGVLISIDPDAHAVDAFNDIRYGVLAAQKGGLTKEHNLSSFSLQQFETFLEKQQQKRLSR